MKASVLKINCSADVAERVIGRFHQGLQVLIGINDRGEYAVERYYPKENVVRMVSMQADGKIRTDVWHDDDSLETIITEV